MRAVTPTAPRDGDVTLHLALGENDVLEVVVEDDGPGFDETTVDEWDAASLGEDGMGLAIIRAVAEDVEIGPRGDGGGRASASPARCAERLLASVVEIEHGVETGVLEDAARGRLRLDDREPAVTLSQAAQRADDRAEARRVEEGHRGQVDHDGERAALLDEDAKVLPERRRAVRVDLATQRDDPDAPDFLDRRDRRAYRGLPQQYGAGSGPAPSSGSAFRISADSRRRARSSRYGSCGSRPNSTRRAARG